MRMNLQIGPLLSNIDIVPLSQSVQTIDLLLIRVEYVMQGDEDDGNRSSSDTAGEPR